MTALSSLLLPFRQQPVPPYLREGYRLVANPELAAPDLNHLLEASGDRPRSPEVWGRVLERSTWHFAVFNDIDTSTSATSTSATSANATSPRAGIHTHLVGFVRATSDMALNANLWDLCADPADPAAAEVLLALVQTSLNKLRRDLSGCSISLAAPPAALAALELHGFVVDPGGIRAMGLKLG